MDTTRWRKDGVADDGRSKAIWAWRLPESGHAIREGMLMLYSLNETPGFRPVKFGAGVTHEFCVFEVDPDTPIDFEKSLFEQKGVSPLTPAVVSYQFHARSDSAAVDRMQDLVDRVLALELPADIASEWAPFFHDGVDMTTAPLDCDECRERIAVERPAEGVSPVGSRNLAKRYDFRPFPSRASLATVATLLIGFGVAVGVGGVALALGPDIEGWADIVHDMRGDTWFREIEMPDGTLHVVQVTKEKGSPRHKIIDVMDQEAKAQQYLRRDGPQMQPKADRRSKTRSQRFAEAE